MVITENFIISVKSYESIIVIKRVCELQLQALKPDIAFLWLHSCLFWLISQLTKVSSWCWNGMFSPPSLLGFHSWQSVLAGFSFCRLHWLMEKITDIHIIICLYKGQKQDINLKITYLFFIWVFFGGMVDKHNRIVNVVRW